MDAGARVLFKKHVLYLGFAIWHIITHFHIIVPWILVPLIFAFRLPFFEPMAIDLASVHVSKMPVCTEKAFSSLVQELQQSCELRGIAPPQNFDAKSNNWFDEKRCQGFLQFVSAADAADFLNAEGGENGWHDVAGVQFSRAHRSTSLLLDKDVQIFGEYMSIVTYIFSTLVVDAIFFVLRQYVRWDVFVVRSPNLAFCIAAAQKSVTVCLMIKFFQPFDYMNPAVAAAGGIASAVIILIPASEIASRILPTGRLSSLFRYAVRILCTAICVPLSWHFLLVEKVINPVAGRVFTDSTPLSVMMCFWFAGSVVGLMLHGSMDRQVVHMAPSVDKQRILFASEALKFTLRYSLLQLVLSLVAYVALNFLFLVISGDWGYFSFGLVGRMFFATVFCTFLTWIAALYITACLDPHPSLPLSIADARLLADGFKASLYTGVVAYRAYIRIRIIAAACLRWCRNDPDRAVSFAFRPTETFNEKDPVKQSVIVDTFCSAIDGYGKDLQSIKLQFSAPPLSGQSIFLFNWFRHLFGKVSFIFVGHGPDLSIVQSNAHSIAAAVRAVSAILAVADERVCMSWANSVAGASSLQPRCLVSPAVFVKAYTSIANLARDLGQLQRTLNDIPYQFSFQKLNPGQSVADPVLIPAHPVFRGQKMFPVDARFLDVGDACHTALAQLLFSPRLKPVLDEMGKGNKDNTQAKGRLEFMSQNNVLSPALPLFMPIKIKDHRSASTLTKPPGRLSLQPNRGEVQALDPNLEYLVAFEGTPADQDAWIPLPDGTAAVDANGIQPYTDLLLRYLNP